MTMYQCAFGGRCHTRNETNLVRGPQRLRKAVAPTAIIAANVCYWHQETWHLT